MTERRDRSRSISPLPTSYQSQRPNGGAIDVAKALVGLLMAGLFGGGGGAFVGTQMMDYRVSQLEKRVDSLTEEVDVNSSEATRVGADLVRLGDRIQSRQDLQDERYTMILGRLSKIDESLEQLVGRYTRRREDQ